jgi:hypothetical protein
MMALQPARQVSVVVANAAHGHVRARSGEDWEDRRSPKPPRERAATGIGVSVSSSIRLVDMANDTPRDSALWKNRQPADWLGCEAAADVYAEGTRVRDQLPVIFLSFAKNARLRSVLIPQFTGGD